MDNVVVHRPRNVDWKRAAALLYGDWGTSKAYVIGLAFAAAGFSCLPILIAVCALTALVAYNYVIVCKHFPDGGGVYSAARGQSRHLAVIGALLLIANMTVTAALSGWASLVYLGVGEDQIAVATMVLILVVGAMNLFGPKHSGSLAVLLAAPAVCVVVLIILMSLPHLTVAHLTPQRMTYSESWVAFVGVILALSGVEAIANITGVMKLDPDASTEKPRVLQTARWAIWPVALEVVLGTVLLGWAMLSLPATESVLAVHKEDMLRFLGQEYAGLLLGTTFGRLFGILVGIVFGLLLISAVNTAIVALIGLLYMMARDGEMPHSFTRLNRYGVPWLSLVISVALPVLVLAFVHNFESLAGLYAIGVVGAIAVNLGCCSMDRRLAIGWVDRVIMVLTFLALLAVELTIAKTKQDALFFAVCVLGVGFAVRAYAHKRAGLETLLVRKEVAAAVATDVGARMRLHLEPGQKILAAARGLTPVLRFALEEARLRQGTLYVLYIKELAVAMPSVPLENATPRWQDDREAAAIMYGMFEMAKPHGVSVIPLFAVSENPAATILDLSATLGVDYLMLGASRQRFLTHLLKGDLIAEVARNLPEDIQLVIHG